MNRAARTARLSILSNVVLLAIKLAVGFPTGSVSAISEAIHSFIDLAAAVMTFFSIGIAQRPADPGHPYGHEKVENVSGVLQASLIFVSAGLIIFESVKKLITNEPILHIEFGVAVMLLSGIINVVVTKKLLQGGGGRTERGLGGGCPPSQDGRLLFPWCECGAPGHRPVGASVQNPLGALPRSRLPRAWNP